MHLLLLLCALMAMTAAQPRCDPLTQYVKDGECCLLCRPGTRMTTLGTCLEPQCKDCEGATYQDKYTNASTCLRQPYCDPNLHFEDGSHDHKKKTVCKCKLGFHCSSSADCSFCRAHTTCEPGHGAHPKGDNMHDTVCEKCPEGKFSNETSWDGDCKKWRECEDGYHIAQSGTDMSDNICEKTSRTHIFGFAIVISIILLLLLLFLLYKVFCKRGDAQGKVKGCIESCLRDKQEPVRLLTVTPNDPADEEFMSNVVSEEEGSRLPEEIDESGLEMLTDIQNGQPECLTENGKFVAQENGTTEKLSRQESQTQPLSD